MKLTASYMCALAVALMFSLQMSAQDGTVVSIVTESLRHGRAEQLSERMHEEIELTVREKGYSGKEKSGKALIFASSAAKRTMSPISVSPSTL